MPKLVLPLSAGPMPFNISMSKVVIGLTCYICVLMVFFAFTSRGALRRRFRSRQVNSLETIPEKSTASSELKDFDTDLEYANLEVTTKLCAATSKESKSFGRENWHGDGIIPELMLLSY